MPVLLDLDGAHDDACDGCLEHLFKAIAEPAPSDETTIWAPHQDPLLRAYIEDATKRLQRIASAIQDDLSRVLTDQPMTELQKSDVPWLRWEPGRFLEVENYLATKPRASYTLADWLLVVDVILQRYLGDGVIRSESEYLTVKAALTGKLQANMEGGLGAPQLEEAVALLPTSFATIPPRTLSTEERAILNISRERVAMHITSLAEATRARMKGIILEHVQAQVLGQKEGTSDYLKTRLFDNFGVLNRDFRRIAVTEIGEVTNQAFIAAQPIGSKVKRIEAYRGACDFCRSINGRVFEVVSPGAWTDGQTQVWVGKTNVGRSASPRRRAEGGLIERSEGERWWAAAGLQHPHCRGRWIPAGAKTPRGVDPEAARAMRARLAKVGPPPRTPD